MGNTAPPINPALSCYLPLTAEIPDISKEENDPLNQSIDFFGGMNQGSKLEQLISQSQRATYANQICRRISPLKKPFISEKITVFDGATLLDFSNFGKNHHDIHDSRVIIRGGYIVYAGPKAACKFPIPLDVKPVNVSGKFIVPGLIDGFTGMPNQKHACAHLSMGVTSIVNLPGKDERRPGEPELHANPSPRLFPLAYDEIGFKHVKDESKKGEDGMVALSDQEGLLSLEKAVEQGAKVIIIFYPIPPALAKKLVDHAKKLGVTAITPNTSLASKIVTIGELGKTGYLEAAKVCGIRTFVHSGRYTLPLAPENLQQEVIEDPFGEPAIRFVKYMIEKFLFPDQHPEELAILRRYAENLACPNLSIGLMSTLSFFYLDLPKHENPWKSDVGKLIPLIDVPHIPADPNTGDRFPNKAARYPRGDYAQATLNVEREFVLAGLHYLAASGSTAFGTLPGFSLHTELYMLTLIGLTPREAIAAATWNYRKLWRWNDLGAVRAGSRADLLILEKDPTKDLKNLQKIEAIFLGGRKMIRQSLLECKEAQGKSCS